MITIAIIIIIIILLHKNKNTKYTGNNTNKTASQIGTEGENTTRRILGRVEKGVQYPLHDVIFLDENSNSFQIDHIFINKYGIWVIETKNYSGTIYGNENQQNWTQVINYGKTKNSFYNPIKQNLGHCYKLKKIIGNNAPLNSMVVFINGDISNVTATSGICAKKFLKQIVWTDNGTNLSQTEMENWLEVILKSAKSHNVTTEEHVKNVQEKKNDVQNNICPHCKVDLILKNGKYGQFLGCPNYPSCHFIKKI